MTGFDLKKLFEQKADVAYSGYWDTFRLNRAFKEAYTNVISHIYNNRLNFQNSVDEISYLVVTGKQYNVNAATNSIYLGDHSLVIVSMLPVGTLITVTTSLPHDLETGMVVKFENIVATGTLPLINGFSFPVTVIDNITFTVDTGNALAGAFISGIVTLPEAIKDYYHFLRAEVRFTQTTDFVVAASTNAAPIKITLNKRTSLRDSDQILISGIFGNSNANGIHYLKQANEFGYFLYSDKYLRVPVAGNGVQSGTGTVSKIVISTIKFERSNEKGSIYGNPTIESPYYQQSKNFLKILPSDPCDYINIDYVRTPPFFIDVTNTTDDLTNWINLPMQYQIVSEAIVIFDRSTRDVLNLQLTEAEKTANP